PSRRPNTAWTAIVAKCDHRAFLELSGGLRLGHVRGRSSLVSLLFWVVVVAAMVPIACGHDASKLQPDSGTSGSCQNSLQCSVGKFCDPSIAQRVECVSA